MFPPFRFSPFSFLLSFFYFPLLLLLFILFFLLFHPFNFFLFSHLYFSPFSSFFIFYFLFFPISSPLFFFLLFYFPFFFPLLSLSLLFTSSLYSSSPLLLGCIVARGLPLLPEPFGIGNHHRAQNPHPKCAQEELFCIYS